jgi:DNA repair exonuclease SbcCD ATPase subunit
MKGTLFGLDKHIKQETPPTLAELRAWREEVKVAEARYAEILRLATQLQNENRRLADRIERLTELNIQPSGRAEPYWLRDREPWRRR